ncbi:AMP-binding protein [Luteimonas aquatica]|uniref:AMP-binding protein n=1 Tax=Luteimonas aquatica TaxID=450364 RepID=UPI001F597827|nr:AMP-binding protein [Luteimonas aquatica]
MREAADTTTKAPEELPVEILLRLAREKAGQPWLFQPVEGKVLSHTWDEAAAQVGRMAAALRAQGWPPGSRIAISGFNTAHWLLADLAITMAGHVPVGLYPKQAQKITRYVLEHSQARALFLGPMLDGPQFLEAIPEGVLKIRMPYPAAPPGDVEWEAFSGGFEPLRDYPLPAADALYVLIYTSGTTGNPKGVMLTADNLRFLRRAFNNVAPRLCENERLFSYLPLAHFLERLTVANGSLMWGAQVHFLESLDKLAQQLPQVAPTRFFAVPLVWMRLQAGILQKIPQKRLDLLLSLPLAGRLVRRRLRRAIGLDNALFCLSGAAPIPVSTLQWFRDKLGILIQEGCGPTESGAYCSLNLPHDYRFGSIGKPMADAGFKLSEEGEILLKHPGVMPGYYLDPERTRESFTDDGWLRTGDKGRVDEDGFLYIVGRIKDIFKTLKGKYVAPAPIEGAMARNTGIDQLCLMGTQLSQPVMIITLTPHARGRAREALERELLADMDAVNGTLEAHEKIAKLYVARETWSIDNGIMTPTMKVKRDVVEQRYGDWARAHAHEREQPIVWGE